MRKEKVPYVVYGVPCLLLFLSLLWFGLETFPIVLVVYAVRVLWLGLDAILKPTKDYLVPLKFTAWKWNVSLLTIYSRIVFGFYLIKDGPFSGGAVGDLWVLVLVVMLWDVILGVYNSYQVIRWLKVSSDSEIKAPPPDKFVIHIYKAVEFLAMCIAGYSLITVGLDFLFSFV